MTTLARLHAVLDSVVEAREVLDELFETSPHVSPTMARIATLLSETQDLVRGILVQRSPRARE